MIEKGVFEESLLHPIQFWGKKSKSEVNDLLGVEVAQMVAYNQNNLHHCYDLFLHALNTVQNINKDLPTLLRVAAFFHDIGKPFVAQEKQGHLVFYGHAQESEKIAAPILKRLGYHEHEVRTICFFISHHDDFISWVLPSEQYNHDNPYLIEISKENLDSHIKKVMNNIKCVDSFEIYEMWYHLFLLCIADASAQSEYVYKNNVVTDSREHKVEKIRMLITVLSTINFDKNGK